METGQKTCMDTNEENLQRCLEEVYGNAQWALRYGATKESLLEQIEVAVELHEERRSEEGWLIVHEVDE
jgi:hypothetical protein